VSQDCLKKKITQYHWIGQIKKMCDKKMILGMGGHAVLIIYNDNTQKFKHFKILILLYMYYYHLF
jgi:tRNA A22 N-methylase